MLHWNVSCVTCILYTLCGSPSIWCEKWLPLIESSSQGLFLVVPLCNFYVVSLLYGLWIAISSCMASIPSWLGMLVYRLLTSNLHGVALSGRSVMLSNVLIIWVESNRILFFGTNGFIQISTGIFFQCILQSQKQLIFLGGSGILMNFQ